jgi:hypothetical protein
MLLAGEEVHQNDDNAYGNSREDQLIHHIIKNERSINKPL